VDDDENPAYGPVIFAPLYDITPPEAVTDLFAAPDSQDVALSWSAVTVDTSGAAEHVNHYVIYRDTVAYFVPLPVDSIGTAAGGAFTDSAGTAGDPAVNSFYRVVTVDDAGNHSDRSNGVGEYDYSLKTTTGTDYTWVVYCLGDTGLAMASDLESHIQNHSSPAADCFTISQWNPTAQTYTTYTTIPIPMGDFVLQPGAAYRVEVDTSAIWTLMGAVWPIDSVSFDLKTTTGTDYTWISLPMELDSLIMASDLEEHIETHSSPAADCLTISQWNPTAQTYTTYTTIPIPMGDFAIRPGRAYRVEVDTSTTWPSP
jgi:hypothetical protein